MSEKVFYKGKWRKVRCECNDSWVIGEYTDKGYYQEPFPDSVEGMDEVCPVCGLYRWYNTKRRPDYES